MIPQMKYSIFYLVGLILDPNDDITCMAVGMDEIVLHQHRKEGLSTQVGNGFVHVMDVVLVKSYCFSLDELLYEDLVS